MGKVITNAFEQYWQSSLAAEQPVVLDEFVLADIPNLDITAPIDPDTGLPPAGQIVHRQTVDQRGRVNNNAVAYSIVMDTKVGDFSFNAMFLRNKANGVIGMIVYKGRETKLKTDQTTGQTGNSLVKSMLMGYDQAAEATLTNVDAGTWQIDYAARLRGQDEDLRQLASQLYGHHTFIGDGFKVVQQAGAHQVTPGVAIVGGLRVELTQPEVIYPGSKPIGVWVDVHRSGSLLSEHQNHFTIITSVADLTDHVDGSGYQHFVAKLGTVQADSTVIDGRGQGGSGGSGAIPDTFALWKRSMAEAGYDLIGQFGTKITIQNAKQVLLSTDGTKVYAWTGSLPKTVADKSTPSQDPLWVNISDTIFRSMLAASGSRELVAGVPAKDLALLVEVGREDDFTVISSSAVRIDKLTKSLIQSQTSIVITGDSLSFNGFDYPAEMGASGAGYATNNPFGLSSWAHLLRDAIFTSHESFLPIERCKLETNATLSWPMTNADYSKLGLNVKAAFLEFSSASYFAHLYSGYSGAKALIVSYAPASEAVLFDVNGTAYDNSSKDGHYKGYGYMLIPFYGIKATITNVRKKIDGTAGKLIIYGCGSTDMTVPKLTGKGAWTSQQILDEYSILVAPYKPDIIYYIIGANDIGLNVSVADFEGNVRKFIAKARIDKPQCEVVLLSTPPTSSYTREKAKDYIRIMRKIADDTGSSLIDMWSALERVPASEYRFDNIHFTTEGDTLVFDIVRQLTLPTYDIDRRKFHPCRESYLGARGEFFYYNDVANINLPFSFSAFCGPTPSVVSKHPASRPVDISLSYVTINGMTALEITLPVGAIIQSVSPLTRSFSANYKSIELFQIKNERTWQLIGVDNTLAQVNLSGSGLHATIFASIRASY